jgi:signal transduction histidine kinase
VGVGWFILTEAPGKLGVAGRHRVDQEFALALARCLSRPPLAAAFTMARAGESLLLLDWREVVLRDRQFRGHQSARDGLEEQDALLIPLSFDSQVVAVLCCLCSYEERPLSAEAVELRATFCQTLLARHSEEILAAARGKVAAEDGHLLARELHDGVSQYLYCISLSARTALAQLTKGSDHVGESLDYMASLAGTALYELRALILHLRPDAVAADGLVATLRAFGESLCAANGITLNEVLGPEPQAALEVKEAIYRIAQEALHNVVKHADGGPVAITLSDRGADLLLEVRDQGPGFDRTVRVAGHLGLRTMHERADAVGGHFEVISSAEEGTWVRLLVPKRRTGHQGSQVAELT